MAADPMDCVLQLDKHIDETNANIRQCKTNIPRLEKIIALFDENPELHKIRNQEYYKELLNFENEKLKLHKKSLRLWKETKLDFTVSGHAMAKAKRAIGIKTNKPKKKQ